MTVVSERAIFVRETGTGEFDRYVCQWGGTDRALRAVLAGTAPREVPGLHWQQTAPVDSSAIADSTDYLGSAALYRETAAGMTVFLPLWFGLPFQTEPAEPTAGALVSVQSVADRRVLRSWFRQFKGVLGEGRRDGILPPRATATHLVLAIDGLVGRERYVSMAGRRAEIL